MTNNDCSASAHRIWTAVTPNLQSERVELPEKWWWICLVTWDMNCIWILTFKNVLTKIEVSCGRWPKSTDDISEGILLLSHLLVFIFVVKIFIVVIISDACSDTTWKISSSIFQTHSFRCGKGGLVSIYSQILNYLCLQVWVSGLTVMIIFVAVTLEIGQRFSNHLCVELQIAGSKKISESQTLLEKPQVWE